MLCHLAQRARIRLVLTTNFDSLIEAAFQDMRAHMRVESVHLQDLALPDPELIHQQNCVLKIHGERIETRADDTLNSPPSEEDKRRFFHYVQGHYPDSLTNARRFVPGLLMVCGYSGSDLRCVQMIKHLLDAEPRAKLLWVCHSQRDLQRLYRLFDAQGYPIARRIEELDPVNIQMRPARIIATVTDRTDLLLYELYQRLTLSLPPGGLSYEFAHPVPPGTSFTQAPRTEEELSDLARRLIVAVQEEACSIKDPKVIVADGESGLTGPLRQAFNVLSRKHGKHGIWFELEDYASVTSLAQDIFIVMALQLGEFQKGYVNLECREGTTDWSELIETLLKRWGVDPSEWLIVLNARSGPGGCAGWLQEYWPQTEYEALRKLMSALRRARPYRPEQDDIGGQQAGGFNIIYAPYSLYRATRDKQRQQDLSLILPELAPSHEDQEKYTDTDDAISHRVDPINAHVISPGTDKDSFYQILTLQPGTERVFLNHLFSVVNNWIFPQTLLDPLSELRRKRHIRVFDIHNEAVRRRRFLYAAMLFRQARHFTALLSEGVFPSPHPYCEHGQDNDWLRYRDVFAWLVQLNESGVFFRKPGGFAWMYRDMRLGIRWILERMNRTELKPGIAYDFPVQARARMHFWIADWYSRAFRGTGHIVPLLEALHHYGQSALFARWAKPGYPMPESNEKRPAVDNSREYQQMTARRSALEIIKNLRTGRQALLNWLPDSSGKAWFGLDPDGGGTRFIKVLSDSLAIVFKDSPEESPLSSTKDWIDQLREQFRYLPQPNRDWHRRDKRDRTPWGRSAPFHWFALGLVDVDPIEDATWSKGLREPASPGKPPVLSMLPEVSGDNGWESLLNLLEQHMQRKNTDEDTLSDDLKKWRSAHLRAITADAAANHAAVQTIFELGYLHVRRAKLLTHAREDRFNDAKSMPPETQRDIARLWAQVCALCWLAHDVCFELSPIYWEKDLRERARISEVHALALGRLGRFFEAHRRLNEADGLLSQPKSLQSPRDCGVLALRRAELHLLEARLLRRLLRGCKKYFLPKKETIQNAVDFNEVWAPLLLHLDDPAERKITVNQWTSVYFGDQMSLFSDPVVDPKVRKTAWITVCRRLTRLHYAKLDDAWLALEAGTEYLKDYKDPLWTGKLYGEILLVYAEQLTPECTDSGNPEGSMHSEYAEVLTTLIFRRRSDHFAEFERYYRQAISGTQNLPYRSIRFIEYAHRAAVNLQKFYPEHCHLSAKKFIDEMLKEAKKLDEFAKKNYGESSLLREYIRRVNSSFEELSIGV
jgi:hypothetical protein